MGGAEARYDGAAAVDSTDPIRLDHIYCLALVVGSAVAVDCTGPIRYDRHQPYYQCSWLFNDFKENKFKTIVNLNINNSISDVK